MKRLAATAALATACGSGQPAPATVELPLPPSPSGPATEAPPRGGLPPPPEASDFTSERGPVHLAVDADGSIAGAFQSDGVLVCSGGAALSCEWFQRGDAGHASLQRRGDGRFEGTWGHAASDSDGGAWNLVPSATAGGGLSGAWATNWGAATIRDTGHGLHVDYALGQMDCARKRSRALACTWTEGAQTGAAALTVDSTRVLRGTWGNGASATDGGTWVFVRR